MNTNRKIIMVLDNVFPPDIRLEKEIPALEAAGYCPVVLCRPFADGDGCRTWENTTILPIRGLEPGSTDLRRHWVEMLIRQKSSIWYKALVQLVDEHKPLAIHVHDLPLVQTALHAAHRRRIAVVADLHENYPAAVRAWQTEPRGLRRRIRARLESYERWLRLERLCVEKADVVIAVVEEMKERLERQHGIDSSKISVVPNTERRCFGSNVTHHADIDAACAGRFTLLYIGGFGPHRGLDTAIKGTALLKESIPNVQLLLVGRGRKDYEEELGRLITDLGAEKAVEIVGWQPFERVASYMQQARIGLVPHSANEHTENTVPHKLFQYMTLGVPVLTSTCRPLKRIVTQTSAGYCFDAGDSRSFSERVLWGYNNMAELEKFGRNGKEATTKGVWNWETTSQQLVVLYDRLCQSE